MATQNPLANAAENNDASVAKDVEGNATEVKAIAIIESASSKEEPFVFTFQDFYDRNFYLAGPWSWQYYASIRGCENFHIYLWIAKDIAWSQSNYDGAMVCGIAALVWCAVLFYHAVMERNYVELYLLMSFVLWLASNFVWMFGEVANGDDDYVVPTAAIMMEAAIASILFYHIILRPFNLLSVDTSKKSGYYRPGLKSRFSYFRNWRDYENIHILCWLGKDLSWNQEFESTWIICLIPTLLIAMDFIWETFRTKRMMEDCVHYLAQFMWVVGNMLWAMGNVYVNYDGDDSAKEIFKMDDYNTRSGSPGYMRWLSSWILFASFWPIVILYAVWIPLTLMGKLKEQPTGEEDETDETKDEEKSHFNVYEQLVMYLQGA